ncbi:MAG: hypothetical protein K1060chlam1_01419 [Candidatus Anoxychlamydiales bacterium]|nr:hypothetical protein [Candidatus Anoxychlamydiales bacterium]
MEANGVYFNGELVMTDNETIFDHTCFAKVKNKTFDTLTLEKGDVLLCNCTA